MIKEFNGKQPKISDGAFVAETAVVVGDVTIAKGANIWFNAVLRADEESIVIGENSNVQDNVTIHVDKGFPVTIGKDVTIGHNAVIHGATVCDGAMVGMACVVLNGAKVGKGAILGAGALLPQNKTVEDGKLAIGFPAKEVRSVTEEESVATLDNAKNYVELAKNELFCNKSK